MNIDLSDLLTALYKNGNEQQKELLEDSLLEQGICIRDGLLYKPTVRIQKGSWYVCTRNTLTTTKGRVYYSPEDDYLTTDFVTGIYISESVSEHFRLAKDEEIPRNIEKGKWYVCLLESNDFLKGQAYYSNDDGSLIGESGKVHEVDSYRFRMAFNSEVPEEPFKTEFTYKKESNGDITIIGLSEEQKELIENYLNTLKK